MFNGQVDLLYVSTSSPLPTLLSSKQVHLFIPPWINRAFPTDSDRIPPIKLLPPLAPSRRQTLGCCWCVHTRVHAGGCIIGRSTSVWFWHNSPQNSQPPAWDSRHRASCRAELKDKLPEAICQRQHLRTKEIISFKRILKLFLKRTAAGS